MKKIFYVAVMAVLVAFTSGCQVEDCTSAYYKYHKLRVDSKKHTVNGKEYNAEIEKCWKVTTEESMPTVKGGYGSKDSYRWGTNAKTLYSYKWATEFELVVACETDMREYAEIEINAKYSYEEASEYDTYDKCAEADGSGGSEYKPSKD